MGKINFNAFSPKILHFSDQIKHFFAEIFWQASQAARKLRIISRSGLEYGRGVECDGMCDGVKLKNKILVQCLVSVSLGARPHDEINW